MRTEDLLPQPNMTTSLALGGVAAFVGAAAWAALYIFANLEHGVLAWGIGGAVGFAIVRGGGHGQMLAVVAAVLAVLSIGTGRYLAYQSVLQEQVDGFFSDEMFEGTRTVAIQWKELGANPTDDQVNDFALDNDVDVQSAAEFREVVAPNLEWLAEPGRTADEWRERNAGDLAEAYTFVDHLKADFHPFDILFVLLGLGTAFGLVSRHTMEMQREARAQIRAEREAEAAAQQEAAEDGDEEDAPRT